MAASGIPVNAPLDAFFGEKKSEYNKSQKIISAMSLSCAAINAFSVNVEVVLHVAIHRQNSMICKYTKLPAEFISL